MKQKIPDTFSVPVKVQISRPNLNTRYRNFRQNHYTIGDEEQFEYVQNVRKRNRMHIQNSHNWELDEKVIQNIDIWSDFSLQAEFRRKTFDYIFNKFKKGIFIQIQNGKVFFSPFSNAYFINEWSRNISSIENVMNEEKNILPVRKWYSNNGLMRYENPCNETDTGFCQVKHMFETLVKEYPNIPDMELFVNRRDFPLLKRDRTEAYDNVWNSDKLPLVSHNYEKYTPLLSYCTTSEFADIPIPTMDDWNRVMQKEGRYFAATKRSVIYNDTFCIPWKRKKPIAVFRGTATGIGVDASTNPRINLCETFGNNPMFDVGLTNSSTRFRKAKGVDYLQRANVSGCAIKPSLTIEEQAKYKYIVHVEGHTQAFRLSIELATRSVILLVKSKYKLWFEDKLIPWVHYVPVESDLSDLETQVLWCKNNDEKCAEIARQARVFYEENLGKDSMMKYLYNVLWNIWHKASKDNGADTPTSNQEMTNRYIEGMYLKKISSKSKVGREYRKGTGDRKFVSLQKLMTNDSRCSFQIIFRNQSTTIVLCKYAEQKWIKKTVLHKDFRHEAFVGIFGVNKILRYIPNFCYTLRSYDSRSSEILLEHIEGDTFFNYIKSDYFTLETWLFIMIQLILTIGVAQRICFFTHNDLCPWNIILYPLGRNEQKTYDYVLGIDEIYRVQTDVIPVILDYDKSHIVHELQSFSYYKGYDTFQDCICLIVSCIFNIIKYHEHKLRVNEKTMLLEIARETLSDEIYCPVEELKNFSDLKTFLEESHKYAHISFANKGNLSRKKPSDIIPCFYKHMSRKDVVKRVEYVEYTNFGEISPNIEIHENHVVAIHPFLERYLLQNNILKNHHNENMLKEFDFAYPLLDKTTREEIIPIQYLEHMHIFIDLYSFGGKYKLCEQERKSLLKSVSKFLETRNFIYDYAIRRMFLKIRRNIL